MRKRLCNTCRAENRGVKRLGWLGCAWGEEGKRRGRLGLTTTEMLVSCFVVAILMGLTVSAVSRAQRYRSATVCAANLRAVGLGFNYYSVDNAGAYPEVSKGAGQWEDLLRKYVDRTQFRCPADLELFTALGSSYDWRSTGNPKTTLEGRLFTDVTRSGCALAFEALPGWHSPERVQTLFLDSSVRLITQDELLKDLTEPIGAH